MAKDDNIATIGAQWGDEGKGKIVDYLSSTGKYDVAVRTQGGDNAGHTTVIGDVELITHLVPSAMMNPGMMGIMGNGMVVNLETLVREIEKIESLGASVRKNLRISDRIHLIMPWQIYLDGERDKKQKIGTTKKGIGPTYTDKIGRQGIRLCDFIDGSLNDKVEKAIENYDLLEQFNPREIVMVQTGYFRQIRECICNTSELIANLLKQGKRFIFEGAQGTGLDIDFGTYPDVTSSNSTVGGCITGSGFPPYLLREIIGIAKAYVTRVGNGPFATEMGGLKSEEHCGEEEGKKYTKSVEEEMYGKRLMEMLHSGNDFERGIALRIIGIEYGATTGRPRRTGWLDGVMLRHAAAVNGLTGLASTKLDVLSGLPVIKICHSYERENGEGTEHFSMPPASYKWFRECNAEYEELPGWREDIRGAKEFKDLPENARRYIHRIEEIAGVPVKFIGIGRERSQLIVRD